MAVGGAALTSWREARRIPSPACWQCPCNRPSAVWRPAGRASHDRAAAATGPAAAVRLGLRANWPQFTLLIVVNVFVGGMVGLERATTSLVGTRVFHLSGYLAVVSFIIAFGVTKALTNLVAGPLTARHTRKSLLVASIPMPSTRASGVSLRGRLLPDGVLWAWITMASRPGEQAALKVKAEQVIVRAWGWDLERPLGHEELSECLAGVRVVLGSRVAGAVEGVLVVLAGKRVQRVPAVSVQVGLFGTGHDKRVYLVAVDQRADRVHPRSAVPADCCEERQSDSELVEQRPARLGEAGLAPRELTPGGHGPESAQDRIPRQQAGASPSRHVAQMSGQAL